jgi:hypothetical protein
MSELIKQKYTKDGKHMASGSGSTASPAIMSSCKRRAISCQNDVIELRVGYAHHAWL